MKTKLNIKKIALATFSVFAIGLVASAGVASAYQGNPDEQGPNYDAGLHDLKTDAFTSGDYETWRYLMEDAPNQGRVLDVVTEDNFDIFVQAHNAALAGDDELAVELRAQLGLNNGVGPQDGTGYGKGQGNRQGRGNGSGQGNGQNVNQNMQQSQYVDADGDGSCDNDASSLGQGKRMGRNK